jgi:hypothetical protein
MPSNGRFHAHVANLAGYGEHFSVRSDGRRVRDEYHIQLDDYSIVLKQRDEVLASRDSDLAGSLVETTVASVEGVHDFEEGVALISALCSLLGFAVHSRVVPYGFQFSGQSKRSTVFGQYNSWRPPFHDAADITEFVERTWTRFKDVRERRALAPLFHMLVTTDLPGTSIEAQIMTAVQCLESIGSYFALGEATRTGIQENKKGFFVDKDNNNLAFEALLDQTLADVDMSLPPGFETMKRLRNAIVHRGFIRESDRVATYIFGSRPPGTMFKAMVDTFEQIQDTIREFVLRLLGYQGQYFRYSSARGAPSVIT